MTLRTIGQDELDHFQIDDVGRLYWKGEQVITEVTLQLPTWVDIALAVGGAAAGVMAIIAILERIGVLSPRVPIVNVTVNLAEEMRRAKDRTSASGASED
jgi:hypothetical protein